MRPPALWDPIVRLTHWTMVGAVILNGLILRPGSVAHFWAGWGLLTVLLLRVIWGFLGPVEARFSAFPPNPAAALRHLAALANALTPKGRLARKPLPSYGSHNPAGALMVWALWAALAGVVGTGLVMSNFQTPTARAATEALVLTGDWADLGTTTEGAGADDKEEGMAGEVHEVLANLVLLLAVLHVTGVIVESVAMRHNLVAAMTFGTASKARGPKPPDAR